MNKVSKILVTLGIVFIFFVLFAAIVGIRGEAGHKTPGILGLVVFAGMVGALKAIWKKNKSEGNENNNSILQK
jgi:hypothetical protein